RRHVERDPWGGKTTSWCQRHGRQGAVPRCPASGLALSGSHAIPAAIASGRFGRPSVLVRPADHGQRSGAHCVRRMLLNDRLRADCFRPLILERCEDRANDGPGHALMSRPAPTDAKGIPIMGRWIQLFGEGDASQRSLLGGKGANLAEMARLRLPIPPGCTITTDACLAFLGGDGAMPEGLWDEVAMGLQEVER